jgi:hypothetical protein
MRTSTEVGDLEAKLYEFVTRDALARERDGDVGHCLRGVCGEPSTRRSMRGLVSGLPVCLD